jgi:RNA polymerase sigma-70 factor (ECF subfamily)
MPRDDAHPSRSFVQEAGPQDRELMQRFQDQGDAGAFEALFRRHAAGLYQFLLRLSGRPAVAEDASQQTWLKLVEMAERGRYRPGPFRAMLFSVARNHYFDEHVRSHEATRSAPLDEAGELPDDDADVGRLLERHEARAAVERALGSLPPTQAEVVALWLQGFDLAEVAQITGASWNTVVSRKRYALVRLRRILASELEGR